MSVPWVQIGAAIRAARVATGISQGELGDRTGISRASISQIEIGRQHATLETLWSIAAALGVNVSQLLDSSTELRRRCMFKIQCGGHGPHMCDRWKGHDGPHRSEYGCSAPGGEP